MLRRFPEMLIVVGAICLTVKAIVGSSVDSQGVLHEPFFLLPIGLALCVVGLVAWVARRFTSLGR